MSAVTVRLHGGLERRRAGDGPIVVTLPAGTTLLALQDRLSISRGEVGLFVVDGELRHEDYAPADGATIDIYPLFGGG